MTDSEQHVHGPDCGHLPIAVDAKNPAACTPDHAAEHAADHQHGPGCGHDAVPHGDHTDYLVDGHLHHQHGDHCDDHGAV